MIARYAVLAVCVTGCGEVTGHAANDAAVDGRAGDAPIPTKRFHGTMAQTAAFTFGGPVGDQNYCHYTITLKQLDVQLGTVSSGVVTGHVQCLNVEATVQPCALMPMPASIATYDFQSASAPISTPLIFLGAVGNVPSVSLTVGLTAAGADYQAHLTFHRADQGTPFDWTVTTDVALAAQ